MGRIVLTRTQRFIGWGHDFKTRSHKPQNVKHMNSKLHLETGGEVPLILSLNKLSVHNAMFNWPGLKPLRIILHEFGKKGHEVGKTSY